MEGMEQKKRRKASEKELTLIYWYIISRFAKTP
jgi:hypothetical protein